MQKYKHFSYEQRVRLETLLFEGYNQTEIAKKLNVHRSTISRELKRNSSSGSYHKYTGNQAHKRAELRKQNCGRNECIKDEMKTKIDSYLTQKWSPQQIHGRLSKERQYCPCHETIYLYVYRDKKMGGNLYTQLRQAHRHRRRRRNSYDLRGQIKDRVSISKRPEIINKRLRKGDFEGDTIIGKNHQGAVATFVDRKSLYLVMCPLNSKNAQDLSDKVINRFSTQNIPCHSFTFDNGKEFSNHLAISNELDVPVFFAHPYSSWERGTNENTNGLIRQYLPKKTDFNNYSSQEIAAIENNLNNRPRKSLGYLTPTEVFIKNKRIII